MAYRAKTDFKSGGQEFWPGNRVDDEYVAGAEKTLVDMGYIEKVAVDSGLTEPGTRPETEVSEMADPVHPPQNPNVEDPGSLDWRALTPEEDPSITEPNPAFTPDAHVKEFDPDNPEATEPEPYVRARRENAEREEAEAVAATQSAEKLADEHGIDISTVEGTGHDGKVTKPDVQRAIDEQGAGPGESDAEQRANEEEQIQAEEQAQEESEEKSEDRE